MSGSAPAPLDFVAAVLIGLLALRGLFRGVIREAFALGALVAAALAVRTLDLPLTRALEPWLAAHFSPLAVRVLTSTLLVTGAIVVVSTAGNLLRRGLHAAGLGFADRIGGAALGVAEGALIAALGLFGANLLLGSEHPLLRESRCYAAFERVREGIGNAPAPVSQVSTPAVATPPRR